MPLVHSRIEQVEPRLRELLGPRLRPVENRRPDWPDYCLETAPGSRVDVTIDRRRNGVMLLGADSLVNQLACLIGNLDRLQQPAGRAMHVIPIHHADPAKVREAIEAYRSGQRQEAQPPSPRSNSPSPNAPPDGDARYRPSSYPPRRYSPEGVDLVNYELVSTMFQAGAAPASAPAGAAGAPVAQPNAQTPPAELEAAKREERLRDLGTDVQVEILPDLDVIILQGRDRDVQEMSRIIAEIERLSVETQPVIEIVPLVHVSGQSMVGIINQVSADLIGGRQGRVSVTPLFTPNSLLLIGWGEAVKATKELIQKLDQPVAPETQLQVFRLRHAPAMRVQATIHQFFPAGPGLVPRIVVTADARNQFARGPGRAPRHDRSRPPDRKD